VLRSGLASTDHVKGKQLCAVHLDLLETERESRRALKLAQALQKSRNLQDLKAVLGSKGSAKIYAKGKSPSGSDMSSAVLNIR